MNDDVTIAPGHWDIDMPNLAAMIEQLDAGQIDTLPFGAIRLDSAFTVVLYNATERRASGYRKDPFGRPFFKEIAPCLDSAAFKKRIDQALASGKLDITIDHIADLPSGATDVDLHVRVLSASDGGCWILTQYED